MKKNILIITISLICSTSYAGTSIPNKSLQDDNQTNSLNELNRRVTNEERIDFVLEPSVRLYDSQRWQFGTYLKSNVNGQWNVNEVGLRLQYKFGLSHEEREINKLRKEVQELKNGE